MGLVAAAASRPNSASVAGSLQALSREFLGASAARRPSARRNRAPPGPLPPLVHLEAGVRDRDHHRVPAPDLGKDGSPVGPPPPPTISSPGSRLVRFAPVRNSPPPPPNASQTLPARARTTSASHSGKHRQRVNLRAKPVPRFPPTVHAVPDLRRAHRARGGDEGREPGQLCRDPRERHPGAEEDHAVVPPPRPELIDTREIEELGGPDPPGVHLDHQVGSARDRRSPRDA